MKYLPITDLKTLNYTLSLLVEEGVLSVSDKKDRAKIGETYYKCFNGKLLVVREEPLTLVTNAYYYVDENRYAGNDITEIDQFLPYLLKLEELFISKHSYQEIYTDFIKQVVNGNYKTVVVTSNCMKAHGNSLLKALFSTIPLFENAVIEYEKENNPQVGEMVVFNHVFMDMTFVLLYSHNHYHPQARIDDSLLYSMINNVVEVCNPPYLLLRPGFQQNHFEDWLRQRSFIKNVYSDFDLTVCYDPAVENRTQLNSVSKLLRIV